MSKLLHEQINFLDEDIIDFIKEIDIIDNHYNLYSLQYNCNVNILYNIEDNEFRVSSFAIEMFVENSLKHVFNEPKDDNNIISSFKENNLIKIIIEDNGVDLM